MQTTNTVQHVLHDLQSLRELGIKIPQRVFEYVTQNSEDIEGYREGGMKVVEISELVQSLAMI